MEIIYTNGKDKRFIELCHQLDEYLQVIIGIEKQKEQFDKHNTLDDIHYVILIINHCNAIGC